MQEAIGSQWGFDWIRCEPAAIRLVLQLDQNGLQ